MSQSHEVSSQKPFKISHPPHLNKLSYRSTAEVTKHCGAWAESAGPSSQNAPSSYPKELEVHNEPGANGREKPAHDIEVPGDKTYQKVKSDDRKQ